MRATEIARIINAEDVAGEEIGTILISRPPAFPI
jgi:hypothetical protein